MSHSLFMHSFLFSHSLIYWTFIFIQHCARVEGETKMYDMIFGGCYKLVGEKKHTHKAASRSTRWHIMTYLMTGRVKVDLFLVVFTIHCLTEITLSASQWFCAPHKHSYKKVVFMLWSAAQTFAITIWKQGDRRQLYRVDCASNEKEQSLRTLNMKNFSEGNKLNFPKLPTQVKTLQSQEPVSIHPFLATFVGSAFFIGLS